MVLQKTKGENGENEGGNICLVSEEMGKLAL